MKRKVSKVPRGSAARKRRSASRREALGVQKAQDLASEATVEQEVLALHVADGSSPVGEIADALGVLRLVDGKGQTVGLVESEALASPAVEGSVSLLPVPARRRLARAALVASGAAAPVSLQTTFEASHSPLSVRAFVDAVLSEGFDEVARDAWPTDATELSREGGEVLFYEPGTQVMRLQDGSLALVELGFGYVHISVAGTAQPALAESLSSFRSAYPAAYTIEHDDGVFRVPITFWTLGQFGPVPRLRRIETASWDDVAKNYTSGVREELSQLMTWSGGPEKDGQLLAWLGSPGTGKTWALRALATAWAPWAEFHYITDPDSFFIRDPSYMIDVLLSDSYSKIDPDDGEIYQEQDPGGKWRVLILEDTGELLSASAREEYGQGLSRLLNVVDGMIGQGLRVLALVTTNDRLEDFHPAVTRPGRCASQIEFGPLDREEAAAWLGVKSDTLDDEAFTLAELYEMATHKRLDPDFSLETPSEPEGFPSAERLALEGIRAELQNHTDCACGHTFSQHVGAGGPCTFEDGRGQCSCSTYQEATLEAAAETGELASAEEALEADASLVAAPVEVMPEPNPSPEMPVPTKQPTRADVRALSWTSTFAPEGKLTDDGRAFAPGSISWRELPLTLMAQLETQEGHDGALVAGRIDEIWRDGYLIKAQGVFDSGDFGSEVARLVDDKTLRGVSVDLAVHEYEIGPRSQYFDQEGNWRPQEAASDAQLEDVLFDDGEDVIFVITKAVIGATTVCSFPAFGEAHITLDSSLVATGARRKAIWTLTMTSGMTIEQPSSGGQGGDDVVTASAAGIAPVAPPADWFRPLEDELALEGPTGLTVTDDGRVYGHAALWDTCHIGIPDVCTTAPHSEQDYSFFHLKEVACEDGTRVACGTITLGTGHAAPHLTAQAAIEHYDDTGTAVADVIAGEDEYGIWVAGALRPGVDEARARELRGAVLSGDWRNIGGNLEFIAALAVNVPGFPVPRAPRALVASGEDGQHVVALLAAGLQA